MNNKSKNLSKKRLEWSGGWTEYLVGINQTDSVIVSERQRVWPDISNKIESKVIILSGGK